MENLMETTYQLCQKKELSESLQIGILLKKCSKDLFNHVQVNG